MSSAHYCGGISGTPGVSIRSPACRQIDPPLCTRGRDQSAARRMIEPPTCTRVRDPRVAHPIPPMWTPRLRISVARAPRGTRRRPSCRRRGTRRSAASPAACVGSARSARTDRASVASRSAGARRQHTSTECFDTPRLGVSLPDEPLRVVEPHTDAHRVRALAGQLDPRRAPVRAVAGVGVLVVRVEVVVLVEHDARRPPPAAHLPLDRTEPVGREVHVVVLVRLRDRARLVHLEEVHRDAEVHASRDS